MDMGFHHMWISLWVELTEEIIEKEKSVNRKWWLCTGKGKGHSTGGRVWTKTWEMWKNLAAYEKESW